MSFSITTDPPLDVAAIGSVISLTEYAIGPRLQQKGLGETAPKPRLDILQDLASRREHSLEGDDERESQEGRHVVMGEAAAADRGGKRVHLHIGLGIGGVILIGPAKFGTLAPGIPGGGGLGAASGGLRGMGVRRHLRLQQRDCLLAGGFTQVAQAQARSLACLHGRAALEIGQGEVALAIAAVGSAQQGEQRSVLANGHELAVAQGPALGSKVPRENPDLSKKWI